VPVTGHGPVDAHAHVWDLAVRDQPWIAEGAAIRRTFGLADLHHAVAGTPVEQVVLVQVINDADETADLLRCSAADSFVAGVVGWADLSQPDLADVLEEYRAGPGRLLGIRHQALAEPDPAGWMRSGPVHRGLAALDRAGLPFDLILRPEHAEAGAELARAHPSLAIVVNHLGKPPIATGDLGPWSEAIRRLAAEPNVRCKISGLTTLAGRHWDSALAMPFLDVALDVFGPGRLMFGSDWPVCTGATSYAETYALAASACAQLSPTETAAVLGDNARRIYGLDRIPFT
jgi:L-fucono-1,5-lactonase